MNLSHCHCNYDQEGYSPKIQFYCWEKSLITSFNNKENYSKSILEWQDDLGEDLYSSLKLHSRKEETSRDKLFKEISCLWAQTGLPYVKS